MENKFDEAILYLNQSQLARDEKSKLLYYTELGMLNHLKGSYPESTIALNQAKEIVEELYTTRASGKISSMLTNDNADFYYGEKYEASLIYFYLSLNYYLQAVDESDPSRKKALLLQARAEILGWDSFLTEIKDERLGKAVFKKDLLAKIFGAFIHESQGTKEDDQIALQLYKDAKMVLFKNYNLYPTYNQAYKHFRDNFEILPTLPIEEVEGKYVLATSHHNHFQIFLETKIKQLSNKKKNNVTFLVQDGLISEKKPREYIFPIDIGKNITFELPYVEETSHPELARIVVFDEAGQLITEADLSIISPLGEIAEQAINEHSTSIAAKTGARVAAKHIAAAVASNAIANRDGSIQSQIAGTIAHVAAIAAINESEKADVRFWSTLPATIRMSHLTLHEGTFKFQAHFGTPGMPEYRVVELGHRTISKNINTFVMNNKIFYQKELIASAPVKPDLVQPDNVTAVEMGPARPQVSAKDCMKDSDCAEGAVCATVRGEYPGSCAHTGLFGGLGRTLSGSSEQKGCMKDEDCGGNRVCATIKGEYPGGCASRGF